MQAEDDLTFRDTTGSDRAKDPPLFAALIDQPQDWALFLDIDGTLLELAETPEAIVVPPDLPDLLARISLRLGGALALVTGRSLDFASQLFPGLSLPIAGLHGAELRLADGSLQRAEATPALDALKADLRARSAGWEGVLIEDKGAAVAAHYRQAPQHQQDVEAMMEAAATQIGAKWTLQRGKMVVELRPASASKGHAVSTFLKHPPFAGRKPLAIGDDITDEAMFRVSRSLGGRAIRVGQPVTETTAEGTIASVPLLRDALRTLAEA
ncbi:trehalose-phosphatase [Rhizobium rhizosphaerae]|uniref:Trehalose 6-phosphate phosphatase n=1 Tax=Xaviernesmea rhizosphaerae TaxID=1672749 RepID=A0A1Q9AQ17_9HYPH|nr:trehalose-phosphatase [Xaviernesmea rhizosphaerae]OLP57469.1 trehalose-phosphatase [Xaviernesmea rhizosphaerae]